MTVLSCRFFKVMLLSTVSFVSTRVYQSHEPMLTLMSQFGVSTPHTAKSCSFHFFRPWVDGKPSHRFLNRDTVLLSFLCPERQLRGLWVSRRGLTPSSSSTGGTGPTVLSPREPRSHCPTLPPVCQYPAHFRSSFKTAVCKFLSRVVHPRDPTFSPHSYPCTSRTAFLIVYFFSLIFAHQRQMQGFLHDFISIAWNSACRILWLENDKMKIVRLFFRYIQ